MDFLRAGFQRLLICFVSCSGKRFSIPEIKVPERNILIERRFGKSLRAAPQEGRQRRDLGLALKALAGVGIGS